MMKSLIDYIINEDMSLKHSSHTLNDYLDDKDFKTLADRLVEYFLDHQYGIEDLEDPEYREDMNNEAADFVRDFIADEAVCNFGYKYGKLTGSGFDLVGEQLVDYIEQHFKSKFK